MKKGLLLVPFMTGKGGTETVIHNLFGVLGKDNSSKYSIKLYSIGGSVDYEWASTVSDIDIKWISKSRFLRTLFYLTCLPALIFGIIRKEKPDFIISTNPIMWFLSYRIVHLLSLNTKVVSWYHYSLDKKPVKKFILQSADYYLAISSAIRNELIQNGICKRKIFTIYNPITINQKTIPRPTDDACFIYLGRLDLDGQKNLSELLDACSLLKGNWSLSLYGDDTNAKDIYSYANHKDILNHISFKGFVNEPWSKIAKASAMILCSKYEGYPMVLAEALSHGVFCITSNIEGSTELVNRNNGRIYESGNYKELASIMQSIINNSLVLPTQSMIQDTVTQLLPDHYSKRFNESIEKILGI